MDNVGLFESSWILIWLSSWCFLVTCQEHIDRAYHVAKIAQHIAVKSDSDVQDRPPSVTPKQSHQRRRTLEAKSMKINELPHQCPLELNICIKLLSRSALVVLVCLPETSSFMATYFVLLFNLATGFRIISPCFVIALQEPMSWPWKFLGWTVWSSCRVCPTVHTCSWNSGLAEEQKGSIAVTLLGVVFNLVYRCLTLFRSDSSVDISWPYT